MRLWSHAPAQHMGKIVAYTLVIMLLARPHLSSHYQVARPMVSTIAGPSFFLSEFAGRLGKTFSGIFIYLE
jgi:hypothetical protein